MSSFKGVGMARETIKTAKRVFEILEYFDVVQRPLTLREVAVHFDYPVSSASAVLKSLFMLGYVDYDRLTRTYMPTMRMFQLGQWVQGALFGERGILALVNYLNEKTRETINIATQSDLYAQYIHVQPSLHALQLSLRPGTIRPLARSGLGWMLLSARSDAMIEKLVRRINFEEENKELKVDLSQLMARIEQIRKDGYVVSLHTVTQGAGIIGMLLPERRHGRILAIGVGAPVDRLVANRDEIIEQLRYGIGKFLSDEDGTEL